MFTCIYHIATDLYLRTQRSPASLIDEQINLSPKEAVNIPKKLVCDPR